MRIALRPRRGPATVRGRRQGTRALRPDVLPLEDRLLLSTASAFQPTAYEQYMLELINAARTNPAAAGQRLLQVVRTDSYINQVATMEGLNLSQFVQTISSYGPEAPLAFNTGLIEAARVQSAAMLNANTQFHSSGGFLNAYYPTGSGSWMTGENVFAYSGSIGGTDPTPYVDYFNDAFFLDWGNPDFGHLKNLLNPTFREVGVGLLSNVAPSRPPGPGNQGQNVGPDLVTQEFGERQGQVFLTGSFYVDRDNNHFYTPGEGLGGVTVTAVGRNGQGVFQTQTWNSGGYSLELPAGTYVVTAQGSLPTPQSTVVTIGASNALWEIGFPGQSQSQSQSQSQTQVQSRSVGTADEPVPGDYFGSGTTDLAVYRPTTAQWFIGGRSAPISFGQPNVDIPVPGNYDGTGQTEIAVYRPTTGQWFIAGHAQPISFGQPNVDIPVPGDYDGSGRTELAVYRPTTGQWFIAGQAQPIQLGAPNVDVPVPGNYDGTGRTEPAVYRPATGQWAIAGHAQPISFGAPNVDIPVPGSYDGAGRTELAVYRPTTGDWYIAGHAQPIQLGAPGVDRPVRGDFDGNGRTDPAIYRAATAQWVYQDASGQNHVIQFGAPGTLPAVSSWLGGSSLSPSSAIASFAVSSAQFRQGSGSAGSRVPLRPRHRVLDIHVAMPSTNRPPVRHPAQVAVRDRRP